MSRYTDEAIAEIDRRLSKMIAEGASLEDIRALRWERRQLVRAVRAERARRASR